MLKKSILIFVLSGLLPYFSLAVSEELPATRQPPLSILESERKALEQMYFIMNPKHKDNLVLQKVMQAVLPFQFVYGNVFLKRGLLDIPGESFFVIFKEGQYRFLQVQKRHEYENPHYITIGKVLACLPEFQMEAHKLIDESLSAVFEKKMEVLQRKRCEDVRPVLDAYVKQLFDKKNKLKYQQLSQFVRLLNMLVFDGREATFISSVNGLDFSRNQSKKSCVDRQLCWLNEAPVFSTLAIRFAKNSLFWQGWVDITKSGELHTVEAVEITITPTRLELFHEQLAHTPVSYE